MVGISQVTDSPLAMAGKLPVIRAVQGDSETVGMSMNHHVLTEQVRMSVGYSR